MVVTALSTGGADSKIGNWNRRDVSRDTRPFESDTSYGWTLSKKKLWWLRRGTKECFCAPGADVTQLGIVESSSDGYEKATEVLE